MSPQPVSNPSYAPVLGFVFLVGLGCIAAISAVAKDRQALDFILDKCQLRGDGKLTTEYFNHQVNAAICDGYIYGIRNLLEARREICVPKGVTVFQIKLTVQAHLKQNPKNLHEAAAPQIADALKYAWPCG